MNRIRLILEAYARQKNAQGLCAIPPCGGKSYSMREIIIEQDDELEHLATLSAHVCKEHDQDGVELLSPAAGASPAQRVASRVRSS